MSNYDASIRISTKINTKSAEVQLATLENRIVKTADKIAGLRTKLESLKTVKIPTDEYKAVQAQIEATEKKINDLAARQEKFLATGGKESSSAFKKMQYDLEEFQKSLPLLKGDLQDLIDSGKAFSLGNPEEIAKTERELHNAENEMSMLNVKHELLELKLEKARNGYKQLGDIAKKSFNTIGNMLKKVNSHIDSFGRKIKETAQKYLPFFKKETENAKNSVASFGKMLKSLALSLLVFNQISKAFREIARGIKEGIGNLYNDNERFKKPIDNLKASVVTLKNALAAAFSPIIEIAISYVQKLTDYMIQLVNIAGQFFAAITGRKSYIKAIKQTTDALKDETKAMNKQLSPLDKLNNLSSENASKTAGAGGTMFEEVPIESNILDAAEKIKDILSKLFEPIKEAWNREGKFVMDSWKYALEEVWKLIKDIGRDFLTVWQQEGTIKIFENLLHIIGDIGLIVGNLARNFREAWNKNSVGLHILENIRDIIGIIVQHIRNAADATVEWSDKLDFYPLLDAFNRFLESLEPVVDAISGVFEDFYTMVLLPLGKWTLEKGLPELLQVFIDFNDKVDWDSLRANIAEFWQHLEPFAETIGEGLIIFIERVSDALANFLNSQAFKDFLVMIENWMDNVSPEDIVKIAEAFIALKVALAGFTAIKGIGETLNNIKKALSFISIAKTVISSSLLKIIKLFSKEELIGSTLASLGGLFKSLGEQIVDVIKIALSTTKTAFIDVGTLLMDGIASGIAGAGGISGLLTADLGTLLTGGSIATAGVTIGGILLGGIAGALGGGAVGKLLDNYILAPLFSFDEELSEQYKNFKWFGENGFFAQFKSSLTDGSWKEALSLWGNDIYNAFVTLGERQAEVWESIKTSIKTKVEEIKTSVSNNLNELKTKWNETWDSFKTKISNAFNSIKSAIQPILDWLSSKINAVKNALSGLSGAVKSALSGGLGSAFGGAVSGKSAYSTYMLNNPAIASLSTTEIPAYATGQVIPRTMKQHLAIFGDNNRETEVVSPISTIEQAVINAMAKVNGMGGSNGKITIEIPIYLNDIEIGRAMQQYDAEYFKQNGKRAFA